MVRKTDLTDRNWKLDLTFSMGKRQRKLWPTCWLDMTFYFIHILYRQTVYDNFLNIILLIFFKHCFKIHLFNLFFLSFILQQLFLLSSWTARTTLEAHPSNWTGWPADHNPVGEHPRLKGIGVGKNVPLSTKSEEFNITGYWGKRYDTGFEDSTHQ